MVQDIKYKEELEKVFAKQEDRLNALEYAATLTDEEFADFLYEVRQMKSEVKLDKDAPIEQFVVRKIEIKEVTSGILDSDTYTINLYTRTKKIELRMYHYNIRPFHGSGTTISNLNLNIP